MFAGLPKLLDLNFLVAFFLPSVIFTCATTFLLKLFGLDTSYATFLQNNLVLGTTLSAFFTLVVAILLAAINREIVRLKEGYGALNPARLLIFIERYRFRRLYRRINRIEEVCSEYDARKEDPPAYIRRKRRVLGCLAAERFPDAEIDLLPTAFGNTILAFEVYSRIMYGLDAIPGWDRLLAVVPKDYRELIDAAKTQVDFWLNLWLLGWLFLIEYLCLVVYVLKTPHPGYLLFAIPFAFWASRRARYAAVGWGALVKAAFDSFLPILKENLGFEGRLTREEERELWHSFSQAVIYHRSDVLPEISQPAVPPSKPAGQALPPLLLKVLSMLFARTGDSSRLS